MVAKKRAPAAKKSAARKKAPTAKKPAARKKAPTAKKPAARKKAAARVKDGLATTLNFELYNTSPWSTRRPQSLVLSAVVFVILIAVIVAALDYIRAARGGVVPVLMLAVAPFLAIYYVWYFNFSREN